jgi:hypothetical protein
VILHLHRNHHHHIRQRPRDLDKNAVDVPGDVEDVMLLVHANNKPVSKWAKIQHDVETVGCCDRTADDEAYVTKVVTVDAGAVDADVDFDVDVAGEVMATNEVDETAVVGAADYFDVVVEMATVSIDPGEDQ